MFQESFKCILKKSMFQWCLRLFQPSFKLMKWKIQGRFKYVVRLYEEHFMVVSRIFPGSCNSVLRVLHRCWKGGFKSSSSKFQDCFRKESRVSKNSSIGWFQEASRLFWWCFKEVMKVSPWCFREAYWPKTKKAACIKTKNRTQHNKRRSHE